MSRATIISIVAASLLGGLSASAAVSTNASTRSTNLAAVASWQAQQEQAFAGNPDVMLREGVLADRQKKRVEFFAEATGLGAQATMEFFLIGEESGNDYEAFAVALAKPRDIYDAMLFIGMEPGRGVDSQKLQFWPKGERVVLTFDAVRAETLVLNEETEAVMQPRGLVFTGSRFIPSLDNSTNVALAAQVRGPYSISANYNEPDSLFDVPYSAPQTSVYGKQALNPECVRAAGELLPVVVEPEYPDGKKRVKNLRLELLPGTHSTQTLATAELRVTDDDGNRLNQDTSLTGALALFSRLNDEGYDPFVTLDLDDRLTVRQLHAAATLLRSIDTENGIRIDPPLEGQLYYAAFSPDETFRDRDNRFVQPWELHLHRSPEGEIVGSVTEIEEEWTQGELKPALTITNHAVTSPDDVHELLSQKRPDVHVILVFAAGSLTHGELMQYLTPVRSSHPIIYVYRDRPDAE